MPQSRCLPIFYIIERAKYNKMELYFILGYILHPLPIGEQVPLGWTVEEGSKHYECFTRSSWPLVCIVMIKACSQTSSYHNSSSPSYLPSTLNFTSFETPSYPNFFLNEITSTSSPIPPPLPILLLSHQFRLCFLL